MLLFEKQIKSPTSKHGYIYIYLCSSQRRRNRYTIGGGGGGGGGGAGVRGCKAANYLCKASACEGQELGVLKPP